MTSATDPSDFEPLTEDEKPLYLLHQQIQETTSEQRVQSVMAFIRDKTADQQSQPHPLRKVQDIAQNLQQQVAVYYEETFPPLAAADNNKPTDQAIERTSANGEFSWIITPHKHENTVFISVKVLTDNIADYEGKKAIITIDDEIVLSKPIKAGIAYVIIDQSQQTIDLKQPITVRIE